VGSPRYEKSRTHRLISDYWQATSQCFNHCKVLSVSGTRTKEEGIALIRGKKIDHAEGSRRPVVEVASLETGKARGGRDAELSNELLPRQEISETSEAVLPHYYSQTLPMNFVVEYSFYFLITSLLFDFRKHFLAISLVLLEISLSLHFPTLSRASAFQLPPAPWLFSFAIVSTLRSKSCTPKYLMHYPPTFGFASTQFTAFEASPRLARPRSQSLPPLVAT
jgi:hypothetical protein